MKHANDWASEAPSPAQLKEFFAQIECGRITKSGLQTFLREKSGKLVVNYDVSIKELVERGHYGWVNKDINDRNFKTNRTGQAMMTAKLFRLSSQMKAEDIIVVMKKEGFRSAELHELLFFGIQNPEEQKRYSIMGLGSVWVDVEGSGGRYAACLSGDGLDGDSVNSRGVVLHIPDGFLGTGYRYLGVSMS